MIPAQLRANAGPAPVTPGRIRFGGLAWRARPSALMDWNGIMPLSEGEFTGAVTDFIARIFVRCPPRCRRGLVSGGLSAVLQILQRQKRLRERDAGSVPGQRLTTLARHGAGVSCTTGLLWSRQDPMTRPRDMDESPGGTARSSHRLLCKPLVGQEVYKTGSKIHRRQRRHNSSPSCNCKFTSRECSYRSEISVFLNYI